MRSVLIFTCLCFWSVKAFKWNCEPKDYVYTYSKTHEYCFVKVITYDDLLNPDNDQHSSIKKLCIQKFDGVDFPYNAGAFDEIEDFQLLGRDIKNLNITKNIKHLTLGDFNEVNIRPTVDQHVLESLLLHNVSYKSLPNWSYFPTLSKIDGILMPQQAMNLSDFDGLIGLKYFSFTSGRLSMFSAASTVNLPELVELDLNHNLLQTIPEGINRLHSLEKLDLSDNKISFVEMSNFNGLIKLKDLDLSYNKLHVSTMACVDLPALNQLYLTNCSLYELDVAYWRMPNLQKFTIFKNNLTKISNFECAFPGKELAFGHSIISNEESDKNPNTDVCEDKFVKIGCPGTSQSIDKVVASDGDVVQFNYALQLFILIVISSLAT